MVLYTHRFDRSGDSMGQALILPTDDRFDRIEMLGLLVDMLRDYAKGTDWELRGSEELRGVIEVLRKIYEGKIHD